MGVSKLSLKFVFVIFREPLALSFTRIAVISLVVARGFLLED